MRTIPFFLTLGLSILLLLLVLVAVRGGKSFREKKNPVKWLYFAGFVLLALVATGTVRRYLYPKDERIFRNTDYHVLEHKGFVTDSVFSLVRAQLPGRFFPDQALWDGKSGLVELRKDSILVADYCEPFYVERKDPAYRKDDSLSHHRGNAFVLVNRTVQSDIGQEGLLVTRVSGERTDTLYRLTLVEGEDDVLYLSSASSRSRADTSQFTRRIERGYPLSDIIGQTPGFDFNENLQELFEGTFLLRERIPITNEFGGESSGENGSPLLVFPGSNLYFSDDIRINGAPVRTEPFTAAYRGETLFYSGMGRTKTDVYELSYHPEDKTLHILYTLPKMQKLKAEGGRLFIASSVGTILDDPKEGGYYFNIFDGDGNFNHIDAEIRYESGSSRDEITFEVTDMYSTAADNKFQVAADKGDGSGDFLLSVKAKSTGKTKWIFDVKDLRESNPLKIQDIVRFIFLFLFLVGLRILLDGILKTRTLSTIELSAYVVVFCLCVVRLILGWRASTFAPVEDISAAMFAKMRSSVLGSTWPVLLLPGSMILLSLYKAIESALPGHPGLKAVFTFPGKMFRGLWEGCRRAAAKAKAWLGRQLPERIRVWVKNVWESAPNKDVVLGYLLALVLCFAACRGPLIRLMNIPVPMLLYILFDHWLVRRETEYGTRTTTARVMIALLAFAYLAVKDAGFTVIFFVFLFLYHAVVGTMANGGVMRLLLGKKRWKKLTGGKAWPGFLAGLVLAALLFLFLKFEGNIMIWAFNHIAAVLLAAGALSVLLLLASYLSRKKEEDNVMMRIIYAIAAILLLAAGAYESMPGSSHYISEKVNGKVHMKYRAEIQKLGEGERIDDLIEKSDFNSTDITYIMRSAHNQWFINQYLRAGERLKKEKRPFILQPHSSQGSSYTTQTTDLVVTRYVIAEHGTRVVILFMLMLLTLILNYVFEVNLLKNRKRSMLQPVLLLFVIGLMVALSATNRIVFVGQDFPLISLQSRVAILFPTALLLTVLLSVAGGDAESHQEIDGKEWGIVATVIAFSVCCVAFIPQQGRKQNETQFDVSRLIGSISERVDILDRSLMHYQEMENNANRWPKDTLWRRYARSEGYSLPLQEILQDQSDSNRFVRSLLEYFDGRQAVKNDPEELLHMRKRNGYWHLALNKKHFFIPSMLEESLPWHGNLLAAKTALFFSFKDTRGGNVKRIVSRDSYDLNILPPRVLQNAENVQIAHFDPSWGSDGEPLLLVHSNRSIDRQQYFGIESADETFVGSPSGHQLATRVVKGDLVTVNIWEKGEANELLAWRYGQDSDNYLAKNIWMNGRQKLFYPLGKESMWSYQFANAVSTSLGKSDLYRDSTVRVSIDYDLHKEFYEILNGQNKNRYSLKMSTVRQLQEFEELPLSDMQNIHNVSNFYFDPETKTVRYKKKATPEITQVLAQINRRLRRADADMDREAQISNAIAQVTERDFDFSAVVLDGNGRIRLLFDHTRLRNIDPNNIRYFNKFMSDMYKNGDVRSEQDIFGNKALQIIPSGPASSFKPIAYSSVTSRQKLAWETLDVLTDGMGAARSAPDPNDVGGSKKYDFYGGVDFSSTPLSIDGGDGLSHDMYLIRSDNLYHSTVIMLGMQQQGELERVFKPAATGKYGFPVMSYQGKKVSFNPDVWYKDRQLHPELGVLNDGLFYNFRLKGDIIRTDNRYANYYGDSPLFSHIYSNASSYRIWSYPETGSHNVFDRRLRPQIRNGFNQMFLGSYPLSVTPLQMAAMGMRLATLNRQESITTLDDRTQTPPAFEFFSTPTWQNNEEYFRFFQRQVLTQLRQVPRLRLRGTARALDGVAARLEKQGYYMYAKTGTLNDQRDRAGSRDRLKHLLVIISDRPLESVSYQEFRQARFYVLYLSYMGINADNFSVAKFKGMIDAVVDSELFKEYMNE